MERALNLYWKYGHEFVLWLLLDAFLFLLIGELIERVTGPTRWSNAFDTTGVCTISLIAAVGTLALLGYASARWITQRMEEQGD